MGQVGDDLDMPRADTRVIIAILNPFQTIQSPMLQTHKVTRSTKDVPPRRAWIWREHTEVGFKGRYIQIM
jgi:hypothetical protein